MRFATTTALFSVLAALVAIAPPTLTQAALASGLGTFTSTATGRWLYYDQATDQIMFGSYAGGAVTPATVFNITPSASAGNYKVQVTDNRLYVSSGSTGSGIATANVKTPNHYTVFNLTQSSDGSFYFRAWNGGWPSTMFGAMDTSKRLVFDIKPADMTSAVKFKWTPKPYSSTSGLTYRTFTAGSDAGAIKYNVSVFYPKLNGQMYAYSVRWIGDYHQPGRPMMLYLGGSDSRTNQILEETDVLAKTQSTGFPKVVSFNSTIAQALLKNYLLVVPASPTCYNTSTNTFNNNNCGISTKMHFLKHYRPWELKRIYDEVLSRFSFDTTRFAVVGTGMGGRGGLRFLLDYPTLPSAVSMVSGALETNTSSYIKALPYIAWNSGEGCWDVSQPNVGGKCAAKDVVQPTMDHASRLKGFPIRLWSSRNDDVDTLAEAKQTCDGVNSLGGDACTVIDTKAPSHPAMAYYGRDVSDVDWLLSFRRPAGKNSQPVAPLAKPVIYLSVPTSASSSSDSPDRTEYAEESATTTTDSPSPSTPAPTDTSSSTTTDAGVTPTTDPSTLSTEPSSAAPTTDSLARRHAKPNYRFKPRMPM
ncbi:hypothetical protein OC842_003629 [Tilletia horrida]|uniref:Feruloyl esterase n=1 Tax=Tilletia horrida TaxID=155126 RepID=A0AAN6GDM8_9BASI|nr:hypothetical protein OC842_003629 [Tilletia horrida]